MTTNVTPTFPPARRDPRQVSNTLRRTLNLSDVDAGTAAFFSSLPAGAYIISVQVSVLTVFNAGSTNTLTIGTNGPTYNDICASGTVNPAALGNTVVTTGNGLATVLNATSDVAVFAKYGQTGTPATTGKLVILIEFEGGWAS